MKISVVGDGMLADGTLYHRELSIVEFEPNNGIVKENSVDEIKIEGESVKITEERENKEVVEQNNEDTSGTPGRSEIFEERCHEINWRWTRALGFHVPSNSFKI